MADWIHESLDFLTASQLKDGGWSYFGGADGAIEPTATAVAALAAHDREPEARQRGIAFILSLQNPDGSMRPQPSEPDATTLSAYAAIVLAAATTENGPALRVADYLLSYDPETAPKSAAIADDSSLRGFAWRPLTYSWVEPTAYGVILLDRVGRTAHPRYDEAKRLLRDRAIPTGGWNYGNTTVYGSILEAAVMPTATALLGLHGDVRTDVVTKGVAYLSGQSDNVPSVLSLAWMMMALRARGLDAVKAERLGILLGKSKRSAKSPWHRAAALLAAAALDKNPFVIGSKA